jgi:hypothetical protein
MTVKLKAIGSGIAMVIGALVFGAYELHATVQDLGIRFDHSCTLSAVPSSNSAAAQQGYAAPLYLQFHGDKSQEACDYMVNNGQGYFKHADSGASGSRVCSVHDTNTADAAYGITGDVYGEQASAQALCDHINHGG